MDDDIGLPPAKRLKISNDDPATSSKPAKTTLVAERSQSQPAVAPSNLTKARPSKPVEDKRRTEYLNLRRISPDDKKQAKQLDTLFKVLNKKKKIVVIAGAGISVNAGIPDFRSSTGLFATVKNDYKVKGGGKSMFDASVYKTDQSTEQFHNMVTELKNKADKAEPTTFHHLLASLASSNRLLRLYTQNVDCIDTSLPPLATTVPLKEKGPWPKTIQLHGGLQKMTCQKCGWIDDLDQTLFNGPKAPDCSECKAWDATRGATGKRQLGIGKLRPRMVLYNEWNPDADAIGNVCAADLKTRPDALIVVGTSAKIPGVRRMIRELSAVIRDFKGGKTIWINEDPPPIGAQFEGIWDLVVQGDCDRMARLANMQKWDMDPVPLNQTLTGTGNWFGVSTPQSLLSGCSSPLSSAMSYASDDELELEQMLDEEMAGKNLLLEVFIPLSQQMSTPAASPQPKSSVLAMVPKLKAPTTKTQTISAAKTKPTTTSKPRAPKIAKAKKEVKTKINSVFKSTKTTTIATVKATDKKPETKTGALAKSVSKATKISISGTGDEPAVSMKPIQANAKSEVKAKASKIPVSRPSGNSRPPMGKFPTAISSMIHPSANTKLAAKNPNPPYKMPTIMNPSMVMSNFITPSTDKYGGQHDRYQDVYAPPKYNGQVLVSVPAKRKATPMADNYALSAPRPKHDYPFDSITPTRIAIPDSQPRSRDLSLLYTTAQTTPALASEILESQGQTSFVGIASTSSTPEAIKGRMSISSIIST